MRINARKDKNHDAIVKYLRSLPGITVFTIHQLGNGYPDICVGFKGKNYLYEIKSDRKKTLTIYEKHFFILWTGKIKTVYDVTEILFDMEYPIQAA